MKKGNVIVDASAVLAVLLEEPEKQAIVKATIGIEALSPGCLKWEVGNAFSAMLKRGRLEGDATRKGLESYEKIPIQEVDVDLGEALEVAIRNDIYAYDAYYLAAAKKHRIMLLSLDKRMLEAAQKEGIKIKELK